MCVCVCVCVINALQTLAILAEQAAKETSVRFGKIDITKNDMFFKHTQDNALVISNGFKNANYPNQLQCAESLATMERCLRKMQVHPYYTYNWVTPQKEKDEL